jgi:5-methylcytosine-specific restriction endonuclease McrA
MTKKKTTRRTAAPKIRNAGTMSESAFWTFIRSALRQKSRWWKPITECKMKSRRAYKGPNKRQKFEYQCNTCKKWFPEKQINVDHIVGAGSLNCSADLAGFVDRLFCEQDNLQVLCEVCHNHKTQLEKQK